MVMHNLICLKGIQLWRGFPIDRCPQILGICSHTLPKLNFQNFQIFYYAFLPEMHSKKFIYTREEFNVDNKNILWKFMGDLRYVGEN